MLRKSLWLIMTLLAVAVGSYAVAISLFSGIRTSFVREIFLETPVSAVSHFSGGGIALIVGAFQLNSRLRNGFLKAHRWLGRLYLAGVLIGGIYAFVLALYSSGGLVAHVGFGMLAICWIGSTLSAFYFIRSGELEKHRAWMKRSYALTFAAVTLRIYLPISQIAGIPFEAAYPTISWLCWIPNILFVEWFMLSR